MNKEFQCIKIYREAFGTNDGDFEKMLFRHCFKYCKTYEAEGETAAMLFALPCKIVYEKRTLPAVYIYAAATLERNRKKGYMTALLEEVKANTNGVVFLRPANEKLIKFYENCGFKPINASADNSGFPTVTPTGGYYELAKVNGSITNEKFTVMYFANEEICIDKLHFIYSME